MNTDYGERLQALFMHLDHGESLQGRPNTVFGQAGSRAQGASVRLWLQVAGEQVVLAGFEAYGCPCLLAAAEGLCRWLERRRRPELDTWNWRIPEKELQTPPDKRARLLLLEDALRSAAMAWERSSAANADGAT